jgi:hypothetical protein
MMSTWGKSPATEILGENNTKNNYRPQSNFVILFKKKSIVKRLTLTAMETGELNDIGLWVGVAE